MVANNLQLGQVVRSIAGRDAGKMFILVGIIDDKYVLVADGDLRKIESLKKKNIKHLQACKYVDSAIRHKLLQNEKLTNMEISRALEIFQQGEEEKGVQN